MKRARWMHLLLSICLFMVACEGQSGNDTLWRGNDATPVFASSPRTLERSSWDTAARLTTSNKRGNPFGFVALENGFSYYDLVRQILVRFDSHGQEVETSAAAFERLPRHGLIRAVQVIKDGSIAMLDADSSFLIIVSPDWRSARTIDLPKSDRIEQFASYGTSSFLLWTSNDTIPFLVVDSAGKEEARPPLAWPVYKTVPFIARSGHLSSSSKGSWVFAMSSGPGWITGAEGTAVRWWPFVERVPFPVVMIHREPNTTSTRLGRYTPSAISSAIAGGVLYVLFNGSTELKGRLIDRYRIQDGKYLGSLILPARGREIAARDSNLFALVADSAENVLHLSVSATSR